jgi:hypothetical protein
MTCDTSATPYQGLHAYFQKSKLHQMCARSFDWQKSSIMTYSVVVNPRIAWEKSVQVSGWASGLKTRTFGRKRPAELDEFLPHNPGIYMLWVSADCRNNSTSNIHDQDLGYVFGHSLVAEK